MPTRDEFAEETIDIGVANIYDAFNNFLKIPSAGFRDTNLGFGTEGSFSFLWTSTGYQPHQNPSYVIFEVDLAYHKNLSYEGYGRSVRCIKQ